MARIRIEEPEKYIFSTGYTVLITDINYGNHMGNDRFLSLAHDARLRFFQSFGYKDELGLPGGIGIIMTDAALVYKAEAFQGDELKVDLGVADVSRYGFDIIYRIARPKDDTLVAMVKTGIVCYNYELGKVADIPDDLRSRI